MKNYKILGQSLLGELAMSRKKERGEREREKKMPFIVATYVYASSQGQRTHSARTHFCIKTVCILMMINTVTSWFQPSQQRPPATQALLYSLLEIPDKLSVVIKIDVAKLSPSSSFGWTELVLLSILYQLPTQPLTHPEYVQM